MDLADASDGGDEWRIELAGKAAHFWQSKFKRGGHILAGHIAGGKDKLSDRVFFEGPLFEQVVADTFIRCQQDPSFRSHQREPRFIGSPTRKVSDVALKVDAEPRKFFLDGARVTEVFV